MEQNPITKSSGLSSMFKVEAKFLNSKCWQTDPDGLQCLEKSTKKLFVLMKWVWPFGLSFLKKKKNRKITEDTQMANPSPIHRAKHAEQVLIGMHTDL